MRSGSRRQVVIAIASTFLVLPWAAAAQRSTRASRVAVLFAAGLEDYYATFKDELRALGYVEGQNLVLDLRWAEGKVERLPGLAADLVALKPDVIVASSTPAIAALKNATSVTPIVMATSADSVRSGFVASLARPGGMVTGNSTMHFDLTLKTIELIHSVIPKASRIGVLLTHNSAYDPQLAEIVAGAKAFRVTILPLRANSEEEIERAFATMQKEGVGALVVFADSVFVAHRAKIAALAMDARLPAIYQWRSHAEAGGLMSYGPDIRNLWRVAARYVDRILKGANPADLPVQQPTVFELAVNLATAKALGIKIPQEILLRADSVIQ